MTTLPSVKDRTGDFGAGQKFLNDDVAAALTEDLVLHAGADGLLGLLAGHGNGDALAQGQAVGLDHGGDGGGLEISQRLVHVVKDGVLGGGDVVFLHEVLGEDLAALQDGGSLVGAEAGNADGFQPVHRAQDQGIVGGNDREINGVVLGEGGDGVQIFCPDARCRWRRRRCRRCPGAA